MRLELMNSGFAIRRLANLATRAVEQAVSLRWLRTQIDSLHYEVGAEGEDRTLKASLEDSHVASYITPASIRLELLAGLEPATATFEASDSSN